jgi:hypothetical protein
MGQASRGFLDELPAGASTRRRRVGPVERAATGRRDCAAFVPGGTSNVYISGYNDLLMHLEVDVSAEFE